MKLRKSLLASFCAIAASTFIAGTAAAQKDWPTKSIQMIVPFAAGGPTDSIARLIAVPMGQALGQTVVVENVPGAGGTIASTKVARSAPDGYTIYIHHMGMATANALYDKLPYDPMKDFEYIGQVADVPMVLLGKKSLQGECRTFMSTGRPCPSFDCPPILQHRQHRSHDPSES